MNIAKNITTARKNARLTQTELAGLCGLTGASISLIESGQQEPRIGTLKIFAEVFGLSLDALCGKVKRVKVCPTCKQRVKR